MKLTIHGAGYVGLVTGACMADSGTHVLCVEIDQVKVDMLNGGLMPVFEPGLKDLVQRNISNGRLRFTSDVALGISFALIQMIAVGTPTDRDGSADTNHVLDVASAIGMLMDEYKLVISKSTVPVGTADKISAAVKTQLDERNQNLNFDVVSNPEFLKEGAAVADFMRPDRIVIGTDSDRAAKQLRELYEPFNRSHARFVQMDVRSAELTKYAANAMLATRISFMNEMAGLAEKVGADIEKVRLGIGSDARIGYEYIYPGSGFGGSCLPKDIRALIYTAAAAGSQAELLQAVENINNRQKAVLFEKLNEYFAGNLQGKKIALWGLAFKPNTDDMREAPSREFLQDCWEAGVSVQAYDPVANAEALKIYPEHLKLKLCLSAEEALEGADALVVVTEWREFRNPDFNRMLELLNNPVVLDGRNIYDPEQMRARGITYLSIGRAN